MINKEKNKKIFAIIAILIIVIVVIAIKILDKYYQKNSDVDVGLAKMVTEEKEEEIDEIIKVYITGEVNNEGVIELPQGSRIVDAIDKAGGKTEKADLKNVNLAYELEDGQKIYIPNKDDNLIDDFKVVDDGTEGIVNDNEKSNVININKASEMDLQALPGIGEGLATAIVKYRTENGTFKNIEDLKQVPRNW